MSAQVLQPTGISIVIPTHNRSDALDLTLEHLANQEFSGQWEVIVVNNNCTDDTDTVVDRWQKSFPVPLNLIHESTPGPAAARNSGASASAGKYLLFMDNDILAPPYLISRHFIRLEENPGCWIVGRFPNLPEQESTVFGRYKKHLEAPSEIRDLVVEVDGITGQGTSMPRNDFERLEGFDERFFVESGEDRELAMRAIKHGIKILSDPSILAYHNDWAGTTIRDYCRRQRIYTQTEPLFAEKYGSDSPRNEMAIKNSPAHLRKDGIRAFLWKQAKRILGSNAGQAVLIRTCEIAERIVPDTRALWAVYRLAIAGAIYKGYSEGLEKLAIRNLRYAQRDIK